MAAPVQASQTRAVPSKPAVTIQRPSALNLFSVHQPAVSHHAERLAGGSQIV